MSAEEDLQRLQQRLKQLEAAAGTPAGAGNGEQETPSGGLLERCKALEERLEQASSAIERKDRSRPRRQTKGNQPTANGTGNRQQNQSLNAGPGSSSNNAKTATTDGGPAGAKQQQQQQQQEEDKATQAAADRQGNQKDATKEQVCNHGCICCCCDEDDDEDDDEIEEIARGRRDGADGSQNKRTTKGRALDAANDEPTMDEDGDSRMDEESARTTEFGDDDSQLALEVADRRPRPKSRASPNRRRQLKDRRVPRGRAGQSRRPTKCDVRQSAPIVRGEPSEKELRSSGMRRLRAGDDATQALWRELRDNQYSWNKERVLLRRDADRQRRTALDLERELQRAEMAERETKQENKRLKAALEERDQWIKSVERKQGRAEQDKERELTKLKSSAAQAQAERDSMQELLREATNKLEVVERSLSSATFPLQESQLPSSSQGQAVMHQQQQQQSSNPTSIRTNAVNNIRETLERLQQVLQEREQ
jgi:hypothetical protein